MATKNMKRRKSRRRNSTPAKAKTTTARVTQARRNPAKATPRAAAVNPKRRKSRRGRRNPFTSAVRNPAGPITFAIAALAAGVGNEVFNALSAKLIPANMQGMARAGIKVGAALIIRNNKTVNKFTRGNAGNVALVIAALAAADLVRPYIGGALTSVTNFIPSFPVAQGQGALVDYNQQYGLGGLVNVPDTLGYFN